MKVGIASDHHGVAVKQILTKYLIDKGYNVTDYGTNSTNNIDYPDYAFKVGESIRDNKIDCGILICNTGIGMSIAANKVKGVRCARVTSQYDAKMTKRDNNANLISLSSRMNIEKIKRILDVFFETKYLNIDRYNRRLEKISNYER